jgi:tRNA pseudouridine55 synthase
MTLMDVVILLNKPMDMTSFSAVRNCRNIYHEKKAGHTGTLDPNASGLMIVLLGKYTKLVPYCISNHKQYHAQFQMGISTDTEDIWGTVTEQNQPGSHTEEELNEACQKFTGRIQQIPPMYSAIKKDGKKLYEYARKGETIEREPRNVEISSLEVHQIGKNLYTMDAVVSSGTYIRTLITDYCRSLSEIGVMTSLVRTGIEGLSLGNACTIEEMEAGKDPSIDPLSVIDPAWKIVECRMPEMVMQGKHVYLNDETSDKVIFVKDHALLAAYEKQEDGMYHCKRGLF